MVLCPFEQQAGRLSFRVQQLNVRVETKTLDNVFLEAVVSVQYQVLRDKCFEAFYSLTNPVQQITAHVYDVSLTIIVVSTRMDCQCLSCPRSIVFIIKNILIFLYF